MKFTRVFTKILTSTILAILIAGIVLPASYALAQNTSTTPSVQIKTADETSVVDRATDRWAFFKELFNVGVGSNETGITKVVPQDFDSTGVQSIAIEANLSMDKAKDTTDTQNNKEFSNIYYDAVATDNPSFFVEISYLDASSKEQVVYLPINDQEKGPEKADPNNPRRAFSFYTDNGSAQLITNQNVVPVAKIKLAGSVPYTHEIKASLWYCGGVVDNGNNTTGVNATYVKNYTTTTKNGSRHGDGVDTDGATDVYAPQDTTANPRNKIFKGVTLIDSTGLASATSSNLCGSKMAYRAGPKRHFSIADEATAKYVAATDTTADQTSTASANALPSCGLIFGKGTFMGCIALVVYHIFFRLAAVFAYLMGNIFDFFLGYSISSTAYIHPFVSSAWETVRDIANIFFIVLLIYVAIGSIFGTKGVSKKLVGTIIINAILINFSLLITRGVIDISNITARLFYAQIHVENKGSAQGTVGGVAGIGTQEDKTDENSDSGYKGVSTIMLQSFDPQRVFDAALEGSGSTDNIADKETGKDDGTASFGAQRRGLSVIQQSSPEEYAGYFALVTLICAFIAFATGLIFWGIGFIFIGRVVGLYISMIFSPFAFMSRDIPFLNILEQWSFGKWAKELSTYAIVAPMTVIYFYIVIKIMQTPFYSSKLADANHSFTYTLLWICIPLVIIYGLLDKGKSMIVSASGELGKMAQSKISGIAGTVGGAALGVASGGAAFAGRNIIGRAAASMQKGKLSFIGERFERNQNNKLFGGINRFMTKGIAKAQTSSFDVRQNKMATTGLNKLTGALGVQKEFNAQTDSKTLAALKLGTDETKGGIKAQEKRAEEKAQKDINEIQTNAKDAKTAQAQWQSVTNSDYKKNQKKYIAQAEEGFRSTGRTAWSAEAVEEEARKLHEKEFKKETDNVTVHDNASLTEAMRQMRAKKIKKNPKGWLSDLPGLAAYESGLLGKASAVLGGTTLGFGAAIPAVAVGFGGYTETEARKKGATESEKNRKKLFDEQNEIAAAIKELRAEIAKEDGDSYDADLAAKFQKNQDEKGVDYAASDDLIEEAVDHHTTILKEDLKSLQDELKNLKNRKNSLPIDDFKQQSQKLNQDIAAKNKKIKTFSNIKPKRENVKKKFEEQAKPKDEKKDNK